MIIIAIAIIVVLVITIGVGNWYYRQQITELRQVLECWRVTVTNQSVYISELQGRLNRRSVKEQPVSFVCILPTGKIEHNRN